jgi:hypothetical protein
MRKRPNASPKALPPRAPRAATNTPEARLAEALILRALARRGTEVGMTLEALRGQVARASLPFRATPEGRETILRIKGAVAGAGQVLDAAEGAADVRSRDVAIQAARNYVAWAAEHAITSPSALSRLLSGAVWAARSMAHFVAELAAGTGTDEESVKTADRMSTRAAYDVDAALRIDREAKAAKPSAVPLISYDYPAEPITPETSPTADDHDDHDDGTEDAPKGQAEPDDSTPDDATSEPEDAPIRPNLDRTQSAPPTATPSPEVAPGWGRTRASTQIPGGSYDQWGRPVPSASTGPDAAARREAAKHGNEWDDVTARWVRKEKA